MPDQAIRVFVRFGNVFVGAKLRSVREAAREVTADQRDGADQADED